MIPIECKDNIIQSGMTFMRAITEAYGTDAGMKLWDTIATTLDPDVKGQIFFAMLTGEFNGIITLAVPNLNNNRVEQIKAIRGITGCGLKEAKDMSDDNISGKVIKINCNPKKRSESLTMLRAVGYHV